MATLGFQLPELVRQVGDGPPFILHYPEAASQTFKKGAPLKLSAGALSTAISSSVLIGFAAQDASGVTGALCPVVMATNTALYAVPFLGTASTANTSLVGVVFNFTSTSQGSISLSGHGMIGVSQSTAASGAIATAAISSAPLICVGFDPRDLLSDTNARMHVVVRFQNNGWINGNA